MLRRLPRRAGTGSTARWPARAGSCGSCNCWASTRWLASSEAIEACLREQLDSAEAVIQRTRSLAAIEAAERAGRGDTSEAPAAPRVDVPLPDLSRFDQLLSGPVDDGPVSVFFA